MVKKMSSQLSGTLSRIIQFTAALVFLFALWRLWLLWLNPEWFFIDEYNFYTLLATLVVGVGLLAFDEVFKPGEQFVGWKFLCSVGVFSLVIGLLLAIFPEFSLNNPVFLPARAVGLLVFGVLIIVESMLVRAIVVQDKLDIGRGTIAPILIKLTGILVMAWGVYNVVWLLRRWVAWNVHPFSQWQALLLGIGSIFIGLGVVGYIESQKQKAFFQNRRVPLAGAFLLLLLSLLVTNVFLEVFSTLILPITLILSATLIVESLYFINSPTRHRRKSA